jgi:hypothetical protein
MSTAEKATIGKYTVWRDADETQRWLDAFGPNVNKVIEEFVNLPMLAGGTPAAYLTTLVGASTVALVAGALGGDLLITTAGAENDGVNMQALGEAFLPTATNKIYFGISFQVSDETESDFLLGLAITSTAALGGVTDGIYFRKIDGSTTCNLVVETASTETEQDVLTVAAATDYILEWTWDGSAMAVYVDGVAGTTPTITNIPTVEYMSPIIEFLTGDNAAITMTIHWMRAIQIG